jgi:hypothetical protein
MVQVGGEFDIEIRDEILRYLNISVIGCAIGSGGHQKVGLEHLVIQAKRRDGIVIPPKVCKGRLLLHWGG